MSEAVFSQSILAMARPGLDLEALRRIGPIQRGIPRSQLTVPISPNGRVDDTVVFADPVDPAKTYYLPRYRLRVTPATGRYEITTELVDGLWRMTFGLESFPAPEIESTVGTAAILPHELSVTVGSGGQLARDYPVAEFTPGFEATGVRPVVVLALTLPERDALLRAFTRDDEPARLVVRRGVSVAIPVAEPEPFPGGVIMALPDGVKTHVILPDLVLSRGPDPIPEPIRHFQVVPVPDHGGDPEPGPNETLQLQTQEQLKQMSRIDQVAVRQELVVDRSFARFAVPRAAAVPLAPITVVRNHRTPGPVVRDHRTDPDPVIRDHRLPRPGGDVFFPGPRPFPRPLPDPQPDPIIIGDQPQPEPHFLIVTSAPDAVVPLRFDVAAHPYLFPSGQPTASGGGFVTLVVPWPADGPASRNHVYFQDQAAGKVFYHLPDAFLIGSRDEAPYGPELSFTVGRTGDADAGTEKSLALISVHLVPQTSAARLFAAADALAGHVPAGGGAPELRPAVHPATCSLELPSGAVTTAAAPDLVRGWWVAESFGFDDLRDVYAVLTTGGGASALLRGRVDVTVNDEVHQVPVEIRLDRRATPPLGWTELAAAGGTVTVTLHNAGDTALTVPPLPAWIRTDGPAVPVTPAGALPAVLGPGETLALAVTAGPGPADVLLDTTGVRVVVDPDQAVQQTLDRRVQRLPRPITLITTAGALAGDLATIGVQFDGVAGAVLLDRTTLQRDIAVPVPLQDWLLDRGQGDFRYRQTLIHADGSSHSDTDWRTTDSNLVALPQP